MNVLIVADRVNGKAYTDIINKLKNTKTIGVINTVSQTLVTEIGTRYTPNAIIIDTAVDYNNLLPQITEQIGNTYNYIKIVVLAEADESRIFPSASVIKGAISSAKLAQILESTGDNVVTGIDNESKEVPKPVEKAPKKTPTRSRKKLRTRKRGKTLNLIRYC